MTPFRLARTLLPSTLRARTPTATTGPQIIPAPVRSSKICAESVACRVDCRHFAQVTENDKWSRDVWFTSSAPKCTSLDAKGDGKPPPDERTIRLGKTIRTLHERLPTLLKEPLPSDIISPSISLHLFPSTHPHLPTVSGRIAYVAALWTAPVAWGRLPLIGNVKLNILSERMVQHGGTAVPLAQRDEKLIVKWKTCGKTSYRDGTGGIYRGMGLAAKDPVEKIKGFIAGTKDGKSRDIAQEQPAEFRGIFIFQFDAEGRIAKHTIEHTEEGGNEDRMTRVVSVTDWLLGHLNGKRKHDEPALAFCQERVDRGLRLRDRRGPNVH